MSSVANPLDQNLTAAQHLNKNHYSSGSANSESATSGDVQEKNSSPNDSNFFRNWMILGIGATVMATSNQGLNAMSNMASSIASKVSEFVTGQKLVEGLKLMGKGFEQITRIFVTKDKDQVFLGSAIAAYALYRLIPEGTHTKVAEDYKDMKKENEIKPKETDPVSGDLKLTWVN